MSLHCLLAFTVSVETSTISLSAGSFEGDVIYFLLAALKIFSISSLQQFHYHVAWVWSPLYLSCLRFVEFLESLDSCPDIWNILGHYLLQIASTVTYIYNFQLYIYYSSVFHVYLPFLLCALVWILLTNSFPSH